MKNLIKKIARSVGIEISMYRPASSDHALLRHLLRDFQIDLVIDVGANIGQYGDSLLEMNYQGSILSFEPINSVFEKLKVRARKHSKWQVFNHALGEESGQIMINISKNFASSSILPINQVCISAAPESEYISQQPVEIKTLVSVLDENTLKNCQAALLKIDVQGFEMNVLRGALPLIPYFTIIQIELSFVRLYQSAPMFDEMIAYLHQLGFELFTFIPEFKDHISGRLLQADGVFIRYQEKQ